MSRFLFVMFNVAFVISLITNIITKGPLENNILSLIGSVLCTGFLEILSKLDEN